MDAARLLIPALLTVVLYGLLVVRLGRLARPLRARMLIVGERLLASGRLGERQRDLVCFQMDRAFSVVDAWATVIFALPAALVTILRRREPRLDADLPGDSGRDWQEFLFLATITNLMVSPLALLLFVVEMIAILLMRVSLTAFVGRISLMLTWITGGRAGRSRHIAQQ